MTIQDLTSPDLTTQDLGLAYETLDDFYRQPVRWSAPAPDDGLERATIEVPRDYTDPAGVRLQLAISRRRAGSKSGSRGILLSVNGGPGGDSGLGLRLPSVFGPRLHHRYDLIGFDPRGFGASTNLYGEVTVPKAGFDSRPPDSLFSTLATDMQAREAACARAGGDLRPHITTRNTARDMDVIRAALGQQTLNFVGYAYGSYVGAVYGELFASRLDRSVLDSCVNPDWTWREQFVSQAAAVHRNVTVWAEWAAARDSRYGLGTEVDAVFGSIEAVVAQLDAADQVMLRTLLDGAVGTRAADRNQWDSLGTLIGEVEQAMTAGDLPTARRLIAGERTWRPEDSEGDLRVAVLEAITMETAWPSDLEVYYDAMRFTREHHPYGFGVLRTQPWVGTFRSFASLEEPTVLRRAAYPTGLVVQADGDPMDAREGGINLASRLGHRLVMVTDSGEHEVYAFAGNAALDAIVDDYLVHGLLPTVTTCPSHVLPPEIPADGPRASFAGYVRE